MRFWEAFIEDLAAETLNHYVRKAGAADVLPKQLRKSIARELAGTKNELAAWELAGEGWREVLRRRAQRIRRHDDQSLSSPTSGKVDKFFEEQTGIVGLSSGWHWANAAVQTNVRRLDAFVALRNSIAHRGGVPEGTVRKRVAKEGLNLIERLVDRCLATLNASTQASIGFPLLSPPIEVDLSTPEAQQKWAIDLLESEQAPGGPRDE